MQEKKTLISRCQGRLVGFLELRCQCAVSDEVRREAQGAFRVAPGNSGLHAHARGSASLLSRYDTGIGPQDTLKQDSQGLSLVEAGNPGFRRLLPVTLGSFSG